MNAITINLLAEEQMAEQARARDPLKVAIAIGVSLIALATASGAVLAIFASAKKAEANGLQSRCEKLKLAQFSTEGGNFQATKRLADDLISINHTRVLYAPQLALVKDLVPVSIQLSRLGLALVVEATPPPADTGAESADGKAEARPRRPAHIQQTERLLLRLDGRATGTRPEIEVDDFIQALRNHPQFSQLVEQVQLRSIATTPATTGPAAAPASAQFVIECHFKERK